MWLIVRALIALLAIVVVVANVGCAECAKDFDCTIGNQCVEGACVAADGEGFDVVDPADGRVDDVFDLRVKVRFRGAVATLRVDALDGDACLPFVPAQLTLLGDDDEVTEQEVVFPGLFARGANFKVRLLLDINGREIIDVVDLHGPAVDEDAVGGFSFTAPVDDDADAVDDPWIRVEGDVDGGRVEAFVEPVGGEPTPHVVVAEGAAAISTFLPLVRGAQVLWVEQTDADDVTRACGFGVLAGPADDDAGALEVALLTEGGDDGWLDLSVRFDAGDEAVVCDAERSDARCRTVVAATGPAEHNVQIVQVFADNATVEIAAVPLAISDPVTAWVRVSRAGRHQGFFGPFTVFPDTGQAWFAGRVLLQAGRVQDLAAVDDVVFGSPW